MTASPFSTSIDLGWINRCHRLRRKLDLVSEISNHRDQPGHGILQIRSEFLCARKLASAFYFSVFERVNATVQSVRATVIRIKSIVDVREAITNPLIKTYQKVA